VCGVMQSSPLASRVVLIDVVLGVGGVSVCVCVYVCVCVCV